MDFKILWSFCDNDNINDLFKLNSDILVKYSKLSIDKYENINNRYHIKSELILKYFQNVKYIINDIGQINGNDFKKSVAVVNACNEDLDVGSGITGALVKTMGDNKWHKLMKTAKYINNSNVKLPLKTSDVVYTLTDGKLKQNNVKYIIHALGPIINGDFTDYIDDIKNVIINILKMAKYLKIKTLILPAISGGIYAGNKDNEIKVRKLILQTINEYYSDHFNIYLISYSENDNKLWFNDPFNINRFIEAQNSQIVGNTFKNAIKELKMGHKTSHWIWYIFPQINGLIPDPSEINKIYSISNVSEGKAYVENKLLRKRLIKSNKYVLRNIEKGKTIKDIFDDDYKKYISSLTLFYYITMNDKDELFNILNKIKNLGIELDKKTLHILKEY